MRTRNFTFILSAVILLASIQLSYADGVSFTVNVPNNQGGYTAVILQETNNGYIGPQGEYYPQFPSVAQLQAMYGPNASYSSTPQDNVVTIPPPELPIYVQPDPPAPDYIWVPGYWAYSSFWEDYYWVPGTWVQAPFPGYLWTPGYWYWRHGHYVFSDGYWGFHIGFYGGINYGHGYEGRGFSGGHWDHGHFFNKSINETNTTTVTNNSASFNGGPGGTSSKPTFAEKAGMKEKHFPPTAAQKWQIQAARKNSALRASANHGKPAIAATARPGAFKGKGIVAAKRAGAFYNKTKPMAKQPWAAHHAKAPAHVKPKPKPRVKKPEPKNLPPNNGNAAVQ